MKTFALAAVALLATPSIASAKVYSFVGDFNTSVFRYGTGTNGVTFSPIPGSQNCVGNASFTCHSSGNGSLGIDDLPAIGLNTGQSAISAYTFTLPGQTVFLHPGATLDAILQFVAPTSGLYNFTANFSRIDTTANGNGVGLSVFRNSDLLSGNTISQTGSGAALTGSKIQLNAGDILSFGVNNAGDVSYDSTGLTGSVANAVPEAATWAMMILGFGVVGGALRRRKSSVTTNVSFA